MLSQKTAWPFYFRSVRKISDMPDEGNWWHRGVLDLLWKVRSKTLDTVPVRVQVR